MLRRIRHKHSSPKTKPSTRVKPSTTMVSSQSSQLLSQTSYDSNMISNTIDNESIDPIDPIELFGADNTVTNTTTTDSTDPFDPINPIEPTIKSIDRLISQRTTTTGTGSNNRIDEKQFQRIYGGNRRYFLRRKPSTGRPQPSADSLQPQRQEGHYRH